MSMLVTLILVHFLGNLEYDSPSFLEAFQVRLLAIIVNVFKFGVL